MDVLKCISLIDSSMRELDQLGLNSKYYRMDDEPILSTRNVLDLLKAEIQRDSRKINERVLRAMHDLGMSSYKDFENTPVETAIGKVTELLYRDIPYYRDLKPLLGDFGKGDPV